MGRFERAMDRLADGRARNEAAIERLTAPQPYFVAEAFQLPDGRAAMRIVEPLTLDELAAMDGLA